MDRFFSHQQYLLSLIESGRIRPIDGDAPIAEGLTAMRVGGHTPGSRN